MRALIRHMEHDELDESIWGDDSAGEGEPDLEEGLEIEDLMQMASDSADFLEDGGEDEPDDLTLPRDSKELGKLGEAIAARFLEQRGYEIIERNWTCAFGEADIIARDDDCLVFVEVKTRRGIKAGLPEDAVTREKRRRYEGIALSYLNEYQDSSCNVRFDVIAMALIGGNRAFLRHHANAFTCEDF